MSRHRSIVIALALVAIVVVGCGSTTTTAVPSATSTPTPATAVPSVAPTDPAAPSASPHAAFSGTTGRITNETDGYSITLPDEWLRLDLSGEDMDAIVAAASASSPDLAATLQSQMGAMILAGVDFWAIKTDGLDVAYPSNANIIEQPTMGATLDLLERITVTQLEQLDATSGGTVAHERVDLPVGEALHLSYGLETTGVSGAGVKAIVEQYVVPHDAELLILTVSGIDRPKTIAEADGMARSLTFGD